MCDKDSLYIEIVRVFALGLIYSTPHYTSRVHYRTSNIDNQYQLSLSREFSHIYIYIYIYIPHTLNLELKIIILVSQKKKVGSLSRE